MEKQTVDQAFDLRVHIRNSKTGQVEKTQRYQMRVQGGSVTFSRDGKIYSPDGVEIVSPEEKRLRERELRLSLAKKATETAKIEERKKEKAHDEAVSIELKIEETKREMSAYRAKKTIEADGKVEEAKLVLKTLEQKHKEAEDKYNALNVSCAAMTVKAKDATDSAREFSQL